LTPFSPSTSITLATSGGPGRDLSVWRREHRNRVSTPPGDLQHLSATQAIAERMNGTGWNVYQRACGTHDGLTSAREFDMSFRDVERFVPVVAVRRRARSFVTGLHGDLLVSSVGW
jgi:hypothetical protein